MITVSIPSTVPEPRPLPFGGESPSGTRLGINSRCFTVNGLPVLPVMGEFHFTRWPAEEWEKSLRKMRAGGIGIVSTYVFWIHHEEECGKWDFSGSRSLRGFLSICKKLKFPVLLRIGPWSHGECRNGGFPDWLVQDRRIRPRTNDPAYLRLVSEWYGKIFEQAKGLLWENGGPVLGVQLENEYGHCGGLTGAEGEAHMRRLKQIAVEMGFDVPFYTATGWGGAVVVDGEMLPVFGAYADAPWAQCTPQMPANENYLFSDFRDDGNIGEDLSAGQSEGLSYDAGKYPFATAELGGGLQVTAHRRPVVSPDDTAALALCKLGCGASLIGYYMYHGGTNPDGRLTTLQESKATGFPNDLPVKSYDFQAPIHESGELGDSYRRLKILHMALKDFGASIAPAFCAVPANAPDDPEDTRNVRCCVRHNAETGEGFLFLNNHQRLRKMQSHADVHIRVLTPEGMVSFPPLNIPNHFCGIFPYHLRMGDAVLECTNAQPLCRIGGRYFFFADGEPVYRFRSGYVDIVTLSTEEAENAWKIGGSLYLTKGGLYEENGAIRITSERTSEKVVQYGPEGGPHEMFVRFDPVRVGCAFREIGENETCQRYSIHLDEIPADRLEDLFLDLDFIGDRAQIFLEKRMAGDWFTTGLPWHVPLRRFGYARDWEVRVYPTVLPVYHDIPVESGCGLKNVSAVPQYSRLLPPNF